MVSSSRFQTAAYALCDSPVGLLAHTLDVLRPCLALGQSGALSSLWTPATLLNWTMMRWLPGPEAGLRWLQRAKMEIKGGQQLWQRYSNVPLGISQFGRSRGAGGTEDAMLGWAEAWQRVTWMKRREDDDAVRPEWERPEELVEDLKDSFGKAWAARIKG
ncbi:hypothetical protein MPH_03967 [Macrophomina phaseolina MS6]|uniref:Uncharacterized protein n=1 Tax=Macrophomina phaseolina (strain MS6) TaxID=1126212 RepID=K2R8K1_MACPH|nr:hypothetical protein MPH_03967 [Macrophomina phaseolina MS6]